MIPAIVILVISLLIFFLLQRFNDQTVNRIGVAIGFAGALAAIFVFIFPAAPSASVISLNSTTEAALPTATTQDGETGESTNTPVPPTDTPVPPTDTPIPPTVIPSPTTTSTPTPIQDTIPGSILMEGQSWFQNSMSVRVYDHKLVDYTCVQSGLYEWHVWSEWKIDIVNNTGSQLVADIFPDHFFLVDDQGDSVEFYLVDNDWKDCAPNVFRNEGEVDVKMIDRGSTVRIRAYAKGQIGSSSYYRFGITSTVNGRITNAAWDFPIPR